MSEIVIRNLLASDIDSIAAAFARLGWNKPAAQYERYFSEQQAGDRLVLVAMLEAVFAGYVTIVWQSHYRPFREAGLPEIVDFNVLPHFRKRGIGSRLLDQAEMQIAAVKDQAGIGVGMTADYGAAQRMYVRRGYIPDGRGLMVEGLPVIYGKTLLVDDDLCLFFTKKLSPGA